MRKKEINNVPKGWTVSNDTIVHTMTTGKLNNYVLNDDKAKQQLLTSAKRQNVELGKQTKTSTKFDLCAGTYKETIFPVLSEWAKADLAMSGVRLNAAPRLDVHLTSLRRDNETTAKATQTVAEFDFNGKKIKLHMYHTNQSGLVQGSNHDMFYRQFFLPMIEEVNQLLDAKIRRFNELITSTIMPATNLWAHRMGRAGARRVPPSAPQGFSQDSLGLPALGNKSSVQPTLEEDTVPSSTGLEDHFTSTPNPSPASSPTRRQSLLLLTPPAPAPASAPPVPLCSQASHYLTNNQLAHPRLRLTQGHLRG